MNPRAPRSELARIIYATHNSVKGYRRVGLDEAAFRTQIVVLIAILPAAAWLAQSWFRFGVLVAAWLLVLVAELGNSAIEAAVDRVGREHHDLTAKAKDAGSAMVMTSMIVAALVWLMAIVERFG